MNKTAKHGLEITKNSIWCAGWKGVSVCIDSIFAAFVFEFELILKI